MKKSVRRKIAQLTPEQRRRLLARARARAGGGDRSEAHLRRVRRAGSLPLSSSQEPVWFLVQLDPESPAYTAPWTLSIEGHPNYRGMVETLHEIERRHGILRAVFHSHQNRFTQTILDAPVTTMAVVDLASLDGSDRDRTSDRIGVEEALRPFDLSTGPSMRCSIVTLAKERHLLLFNIHHIVSDGWTIPILFGEIRGIYGAYGEGAPSHFKELPFQYTDYSVWQLRRLSAVSSDQLGWWREQLQGAPELLDIAFDHPRPAEMTFRGDSVSFTWPAELTGKLRALSRELRVTLYVVMLAAFDALLMRYTAETDIVIGSPSGARTHSAIEGMIGCLLNMLTLRSDLSGDPSFRSLVTQTKGVVQAAHDHAELPFNRLVAELKPRRDPRYTPVFQVLFILQNVGTGVELSLPGLQLGRMEVRGGRPHNDLIMEVMEGTDALWGSAYYNTDLLNESTVAQMLRDLATVLTAAVANPDVCLSELVGPIPSKTARIAIAATFTADLVREPIDHWLGELGVRGRVAFAPYNQVFQELLSSDSLLRSNDGGINVVLLRVEDWVREQGGDPFSPEQLQATRVELARHADEMAVTMRAAAAARSIAWLVGLCPPSDRIARDVEIAAVVSNIHRELTSCLEGIEGVRVFDIERAAQPYAVEIWNDSETDAYGHIPYTPPAFAAIGTVLARRLRALRSPPYKVVVLDCDNTLWGGVCGEVQPAALRVDGPFRFLQSFVKACSDAGMLLCLASKNEDADVAEVFAQRPEMALRLDDFVARRVNWNDKSANLRALAEELNLGLDSFAFVDDNPLECAAVRADCPQVCVIELPPDPEQIPLALQHAWALDRGSDRVTNEDRRRKEMVRQNRAREIERQQAPNFDDFLESLALSTQFEPMRPEHVERVSQLTKRTNQFNFTTIRRSASEIQVLADRGELEIFVAHVKDRFGDYGLVGVVAFAVRNETLCVDTFLLSCRVLGRRVEHHLFGRFADLARERSCHAVEIPYRRTARNTPARRFVESLGDAWTEIDGDGILMRIPVDQIGAALDRSRRRVDRDARGAGGEVVAASASGRSETESSTLARIVADRLSAQRIAEIIDERHRQARKSDKPFEEPRTPTEVTVANIWKDILRLDRVGLHDDFFDMGGYSMQVAEVLGRVQHEFQVRLSFTALFDSPTIATIAELIDSGSGASDGNAATGFDALACVVSSEPAQRYAPFPMTPIQQAYWMGRTGHFDLGVAAHSYTIHETTELDVPRLQNALNRLIDQHEALRLVAVSETEQRILEQAPHYEITFVDLANEPPDRAAALLQEVHRHTTAHERSAESWPLWDVNVVRRVDGRYQIHIRLDLLLADAPSLQMLYNDLLRLYADPASLLEPQALSFRDYVMATRALREHSEAAEREWDYWRDRLDTLPGPPELPQAGALPSVSRFVRRTGVLDSTVWKAIRKTAKSLGLSPAGVVLAAYAECIAAWSSNRHFLLTLLTGFRNPVHEEVYSVAGCFTSTILLELDWSGGSLLERARRAQRQLLDDMLHSTLVSGVEVLRELKRIRGSSAATLSPVVLASMLPAGEDALAVRAPPSEGAALLGDEVESGLVTPQVLIDQQIFETADGAVRFNWDVVEDAFPAGMIDDLFTAYSGLLESLATDRERWSEPATHLISDADLDRRHAINATGASVSDDSLPAAFLARVPSQPERVAVSAMGMKLTYAQLAAATNRWAWDLQERGVERGELVAVAMEKGWEQVVAVLAVQQAGAAYLPMSPHLPPDRIAHLIDHGGVRFVLTRGAAPTPPLPEGAVALPIDAAKLAERRTAVRIPIAPADLAYVIYTSGSTGLPKGVMIDHRGAINTIVDVNRRFSVTSEDRTLALSDLSFDLSVYDIFGTLAAGGTIVIPSREAARDPAAWFRLVAQEQITIWNSVPALMDLLVEHAERAGVALPKSLRLVMMSGDWIPVKLPDRIRALGPGIDVISLGGATEASIWSILHRIGEVDSSWNSIPYGRPMANQTVHVLDEELRPCPTWVPGELYIGGSGVAVGYWHDAERTSASFVAHPDSGGRLYATGDLGRYLPSGDIEFLGRKDFQVKIQGYRVELGEIEAALGRYPGITDAVALARRVEGAELGPATPKYLVAYVVHAAGAQLDPDELREFLRDHIPDYMVPTVYVVLDAFPLTPNGKVDRQALPASAAALAGRDPDALDEPRDATERSLVEMWQEVLGVDSLGIHNDFFALGGNSLLALRLLGRIRDRFGGGIGLAAIMERGTVAGLADVIRQSAGQSTRLHSPLVRIQTADTRPIFCVHPVGGSVLCYAELARSLGEGQGFYGLQSRGLPGSDEVPSDSIEEMAARYIEEIRTVQDRGPYQLAGWSMGGVVAHEMARRLTGGGEEIAVLVLIDSAFSAGAASPLSLAALLGWFARDLGALFNAPIAKVLDEEALEGAAESEAFELFLTAARAVQLAGGEIDPAQMKQLFTVFRANSQALARHCPATFDGDAVLIVGADSHLTSHADVEGWRSRVGGKLTLIELPGDHYSLLRYPCVRDAAEALRARLA